MRISDYEEKLVGKKCTKCNTSLTPFLGRTFPHEGGIIVEDFIEKVILFAPCNNCKHENSLVELGIIKDDGRKQVRLIHSTKPFELKLDAKIEKIEDQ